MIDAHSHLGTDAFHHIEGELDTYIANCRRLGITDANIMPVACPEYRSGTKTVRSLEWSYEKDDYIKSRITEEDGVRTTVLDPENPYREYNGIVKGIVESASGMRLRFVPLIHPTLDTQEHTYSLLSENPVAVKLHGVAAGIGPDDIDDAYWRPFAQAGIPIIVHTDHWRGRQEDNPLSVLYGKNDALGWARTFMRNGVRAFITHGARLCERTIELINGSDLFLLGIAPDLLIGSETQRLAARGDYLTQLMASADTAKLAFDLDYPWNIPTRMSYDFDWGSIGRIGNRLPEGALERVTETNARRFFRL
ncbi:hypothetical protein JXB02_01270 [Candidatus Woesearchaeota archaeon]|nr:hypothetical protein [Candidatus Woesearchaeota archaeon]